MTRKSLPRVIALAPQGIVGITIAAAACRANALGIIDCSFEDLAGAREAVAQLAKLTSLPYGIRIRAQRGGVRFVSRRRPSVPLPSFAFRSGLPNLTNWPGRPRIVRESGRFAVADVTTRAEAQVAQSAGFDALMLSGHESGGWCGQESSFVLLQGVLAESSLPVWVRGGIGPNVAAGCLAAGATGVVLDGALILARESRVPAEWRERIARWDGSETTVITPRGGVSVRVFALPGSPALARLKKAAQEGREAWEGAIRATSGGKTANALPSVKTPRSRSDSPENS